MVDIQFQDHPSISLRSSITFCQWARRCCGYDHLLRCDAWAPSRTRNDWTRLSMKVSSETEHPNQGISPVGKDPGDQNKPSLRDLPRHCNIHCCINPFRVSHSLLLGLSPHRSTVGMFTSSKNRIFSKGMFKSDLISSSSSESNHYDHHREKIFGGVLPFAMR